MKRHFLVIAAVLLIAAIALGQTALGQGYVVETVTTGDAVSENGVQKTRMSILAPHFLKIETQSTEDSADGMRDAVLFRGDLRQLVFVDYRDRSYAVFDESTVKGVARQMEEVKEQMQGMAIPKAVLDKMPPEERKKLEEAMQQRPGMLPGRADAVAPDKEEYARTGTLATRNGYPCVKYDVVRGGEKVRELWVTDWDNVKGGADLQLVLGALSNFVDEMMQAMGEAFGAGEGGAFGDAFGNGGGSMDDLLSVDGFPVAVSEWDAGTVTSETVLKSMLRRDMGPEAFDPPDKFKRKDGPR